MSNKIVFADLFDKFALNVFNAGMIKPLADKLGVSTDALYKLGIGINPLTGAYVYPERDDKGNITGITQRYLDGKKFMVKGSKRGLVYELQSEYIKDIEQYVSGAHNWIRVSTDLTCPLCGKIDGCAVAASDPSDPPAVICVHISKGSVKPMTLGYLHILKPGGQTSTQRALPDTNLPIIIVEGYSDSAAVIDLGFVPIGRPSAEGKRELLTNLVRGKEVIIVGDNDAGAGIRGMEATFQTIVSVCKKVTKVLPPKEFKDIRHWKNETGLTQQLFLSWVQENGDSIGDPNIFEDEVAHTIAKSWLDQEKMKNGLPTVRCYRSQWLQYVDGHYDNCDKEEFRGQIYRFLDGKTFPKVGPKGEVSLVPYKPTRAKISDIVDALSDWCTIVDDPPIWLKKIDRPDPENLIAFRNGILDVDEYVQGRIKFYDPTPAFFSFNILPYDFDEDAHSDLWDEFCKDIFNDDEKQITLLSQWMGYNCVPDMSYEKLMLCTGRPRSGKGTVLNTLASMLGKNQCVSTSFQTLCTEFGYQPLIGKLAVLLGDAKVPREKQAEAALEKILQVVGRDPVGIRRMYLPYLSQIYLKCRFTIAMNDLPNVPDQANALEPRLNILHFGNSYIGREDITLKSRLCKEAEQGKLINFALSGLKNLRLNKKFVVPDTSLILLKQLRELTTPVTAFILDCCELKPPTAREEDYYVIIDQLYEAWEQWCKKSGRRPGVRQQFGRWFLAACPSIEVTRLHLSGRRHRIYQGVRLAKWVFEQYLGVVK